GIGRVFRWCRAQWVLLLVSHLPRGHPQPHGPVIAWREHYTPDGEEADGVSPCGGRYAPEVGLAVPAELEGLLTGGVDQGRVGGVGRYAGRAQGWVVGARAVYEQVSILVRFRRAAEAGGVQVKLHGEEDLQGAQAGV